MKRVLITGASSGIGKALAKTYADRNYEVIAIARDTEKLALLAQENNNIKTFSCDLTDETQASGLRLAEWFPDIDIMILNAGHCLYCNAEEINADIFNRQWQSNVITMVNSLSAWLPLLNRNGYLGLMSSSVRFVGLPQAHAYGATKAAIAYLVESLALELSPQGITVGCISPGFVETPLTGANQFDMPFLMSAEEAALRIFAGVNKKRKDIAFPKRMMWTLKLLALMPATMRFKLLHKGE